MKTISPELDEHFKQSATTVATLLEIARLDGQAFYFTDHDESIPYNGNLYLPYSGYTPGAIDTKINASVDNQTVRGALNDDGVNSEDIEAGLFDFANVTLTRVNYMDLGMGPLSMLTGKMGQVSFDDNESELEFRGMAQLLQQKMGESYLPSCPATLGDSRCKVNIADPSYTQTFIVTGIIADEEKRTFQVTGLSDADGDIAGADGYFDGGFATFDGVAANPNTGMDVKLYTVVDIPSGTSQVELYEPLPRLIQIGDSGTVVVGCLKDFETCKLKFNNKDNFRGFPHLTGVTGILKGV